jgi:hypothetical protein
MEKTNDNLRERMLSHLPQPANLAAYREETASTLAKNEKRLRFEKWGVAAIWLYAVAFFVACSFLGPRRLDTSAGHQLIFFSFLLLIYGAVEILKHFINRSRVEMLKEVKQLQLQVLELQASLLKNGRAE